MDPSQILVKLEPYLHGPRSLLVGYAVVGVPMLIGMIKSRATFTQYLKFPILAAVGTVVAALLWSGVTMAWQKMGVLPSGAMFYLIGFAFMALAGLVMGILLGGRRAAAEVKRGAVIEDGTAVQKFTQKRMAIEEQDRHHLRRRRGVAGR